MYDRITPMRTTDFYFAMGRPFSPLYSLAMRLRQAMYRQGILGSYEFTVPVISVGNLTMGGTGKTPIVQYVARLLQEDGLRPAVVSRGYGGKAQGKVNVVSDGRQIFLDAGMAGDEPRLLAETLPGVPVLTGVVRRLPLQRAIDTGADVIVLDDGFQHLQVRRDINLVLFNADRLAGNSRVFPGGELREPVTALHRATHFILTGVNESNRERAGRFAALLQSKFVEKPAFMTEYVFDSLVRLSDQRTIVQVGEESLLGARAYAFCGVARPEGFRHVLEDRKVDLAGFHPLADHQQYSAALAEKLSTLATRAGAEVLLTTEKDLVKLAGVFRSSPLPLYGLRMRVKAANDFDQHVLAGIRKRLQTDRQ